MKKQETFTNAFDHMVDYSIKDYPNGRIKIVPIHEIIITKHKSWPIRTYNTVKKLFMDQMERLLNSAEELNLEEVIFEVTIIPNKRGKGKALKILDVINKKSIIKIKNDDTICLSRAIVTSLASNKLLENFTNSQLKHIKEGRPLQKRVAEDLHEQSEVEIKKEGNDLEDLKAFENYLNIRIIVFTSNSTEYIVYNGNEEYNEQIYLYYHDEHFDTITNITGFLAKRKFCKVCLIGYTEQHTCKDNTVTTIRKQHICDKCNKTYTGKNHKCGEKICLICYEKYTESNEEHLCYMKPSVPKQVKNNKYIYFDFEANQETGIHIMNFCIAYDLENIYCFKNNYVKVFKCDFNIDDLNLLELDIDDCFSDVEKIKYETNSVIDNFCKYFIRDKFKDYTFISHYGKGYDMQPILGYIVKNKIEHNIISSGLKLTAMFIKGINLRFIDSINFTLCGLAAFPKTFGFVEYNIMIQHAKRGGEKKLFINNKCYKVDGYYYDRENKMRNVYEFFGCYWHGCTKCYSPEEICKKDRNKKTMKELYDQTKERLKTIEDYLKPNVKIHTIWECEFDQQKYPEVDPHLKPIDKRDAFYGGRTETIQLYNNLSDLKGRYVDFCSLYPSVNKYCKYPIGHPITYTDISVDDYIKNNYFGIMKCKILPPKGLYHPVLPYKQSTSDNTHKLLFGLCRTCMNKISFKCKHIDDPTLNKHDKIHEIKRCKECKNIKNEKCIHSDEERVIVGTWSTIEIDKAIEKGYKLQKIYELEHFEKTSTDIFKLYVDTFMKYKQEASGCKCDPKYCKNDCKNDKECKTKIQYIIDNTAYDLDIDKVKYNSGLRFIAKICLNNLWGHFGMRDNFTQKEYCFTLEHITKIVFNEKYKDISTMILDEDIVLTEYKNKEEYSKPNPSVNVYIALFTTAHARLKLYELLDILQERVLYMDTDSCIYNDDGSEACKKIESMMGNKLGDLTDEIVSKHNANHIKQFISAGPKDYSMKLDTEKLVSCCKAYTEKDDPDAKVILGRIMLSDYQICCLRDDGECPLTPKQMEVMEKFDGKKLSKFPPGWDAFIRPDKVYEYVFEKPCPEI
ncbi:unnamed protein product [Mytilus edulis]|uniref:DNA-directed DNA polymerase n=1 Tax=Mytilus edulis TaxID=6550 RepID=A0A8S3QIR1_MYTED|nr:unnamed protein product [Mytilus edulis]